MPDYQALLDRAVALVQAERGSIMLYDPTTGEPVEFLATYNFDPIVPPPSADPMIKADRLIRKALPRIAMAGHALLTHTYDNAYFDIPEETIVPGPPLQSIIAVPIRKQSGLLYCSARFKSRVFTPVDLSHLILLVEHVEGL
jgi:hypothetical protein